jgi:hypothetical protein
MRRRRVARIPLVVLAAGAALPFVGPLRQAEALYRYFSRKNLAHALATEPDKWVNTDVTVTDELAFVWNSNPALDTEVKSKTAHVRFDTYYFRCAIDPAKKGEYLDKIWEIAKANAKDIVEKIQAVNEQERQRKLDHTAADTQRKALYWELHQRWKDQPLVTVFGKVTRTDFFTPSFYDKASADEAKSPDAAPEAITILCERVEKPRDKYYTDLDSD